MKTISDKQGRAGIGRGRAEVSRGRAGSLSAVAPPPAVRLNRTPAGAVRGGPVQADDGMHGAGTPAVHRHKPGDGAAERLDGCARGGSGRAYYRPSAYAGHRSRNPARLGRRRPRRLGRDRSRIADSYDPAHPGVVRRTRRRDRAMAAAHRRAERIRRGGVSAAAGARQMRAAVPFAAAGPQRTATPPARTHQIRWTPAVRRPPPPRSRRRSRR